MISEKDEVFKQNFTRASDFKFSSKVANVFDDMVSRSVPFYVEMQRMIAEIAADHYQEDTSVYDLGCSTGTSLILLNETIPEPIRFVGIDDSEAMLDKCRAKLQEVGFVRPVSLEVADLNEGLSIKNASVVVLCLSLQFVRPINRERLLKNIYSGLVPGGVVIIIEKILAEDSFWNRHFIKYYYDMKRRNHYSEMEIAQKREALENVLIPYKLSENITLLREAGFAKYEVFFKWYNFCGFIAKKNA